MKIPCNLKRAHKILSKKHVLLSTEFPYAASMSPTRLEIGSISIKCVSRTSAQISSGDTSRGPRGACGMKYRSFFAVLHLSRSLPALAELLLPPSLVSSRFPRHAPTPEKQTPNPPKSLDLAQVSVSQSALPCNLSAPAPAGKVCAKWQVTPRHTHLEVKTHAHHTAHHTAKSSLDFRRASRRCSGRQPLPSLPAGAARPAGRSQSSWPAAAGTWPRPPQAAPRPRSPRPAPPAVVAHL